MKKLTHQEFLDKVFKKYNNEYTVLSIYDGNRNKIRLRHNVCNREFELRAGAFLFD